MLRRLRAFTYMHIRMRAHERAHLNFPSTQARMQALLESHYSTLGDRTKRMLNDPKAGDFWEADHVVAVAEGGGESDLQNFQTLCVPCHAKKSRAQKERSKTEKRKEAAAGTADLRSFFKAPRM
jgi:5-methylcytosine-specific restriction endonuclease McrA